VTIEVAVTVEFPAPVRVVIVGRLQALLPDEKERTVVLRMDVLGVIDFDAGTLAGDATLRDSRILELVITGDIALRMSWGREPAGCSFPRCGRLLPLTPLTPLGTTRGRVSGHRAHARLAEPVKPGETLPVGFQ
jgi:hypothetical protein